MSFPKFLLNNASSLADVFSASYDPTIGDDNMRSSIQTPYIPSTNEIKSMFSTPVPDAATGTQKTASTHVNLNDENARKLKLLLRAGRAGLIMGVVGDAVSALLPNKSEYEGAKGNITNSMDGAYDSISDAAMQMGPYGQLVGGIMKGGAALGKAVNKIGGGTDGMTGIDAVLGSSFLNLTPLGLINGFGGKKSDTITKDSAIFDLIGAGYTGTNSTIDDAVSKSGKKYGLFSSSARLHANEEIAEAKRQLSVLGGIAQDSLNRLTTASTMEAINDNAYAFDRTGGYDQRYALSAKYGGILTRVTRILKEGSKLETPNQIPKYEEGDSVAKPAKKSRSLSELIAYARLRNPRFILRLSEPVRSLLFTNDYGEELTGTHYLEWATEDGNGIVYPRIQENDDGDLEFYNRNDAYKRAKENENYLKMSPDEAEIFTSGYKSGWEDFFTEFEKTPNIQKKKEGGVIHTHVKLINPIEVSEFKKGGVVGYAMNMGMKTPIFNKTSTFIKTFNEVKDDSLIEEFRNGGSVNVIPEGALHARKHNMDLEGITKKGIPVIDNQNDQQAEIEREEIIYRLEVTQKLEELMNDFYKSDNKNDKDKLALEAGKLLVKETLHNTIDHTNNLL